MSFKDKISEREILDPGLGSRSSSKKKKIQFKFEISVRVKITIKLCLHCRGSVKG